MKITNVEAIYLKLPEIDSERCDGTQDTLLIKVSTDAGITGIGEVDSVPLVAKAIIEAPASHSIATGLRELLIGEDPLEIEKCWNKMYEGTIYFGRYGPALHAMSGVDIALWDIRGKVEGRSVSSLLGGVRRSRIKAYASALMPDTPVEAAKKAEQFAREGYQAMKFGWGPIGMNPRRDEEFIWSIRSAVGSDIDLMIDAGFTWDLKSALKMAEIYEKYNLFWLEEPLHPDNLEGYRELSDRTNILIAAGEQESGIRAFERLLREGHVDVLQPDLARCGGLTEGKKIADLADFYHKKIVTHSFKTGILLSASTHFAASIANGFMVEYTMSDSPLARDLVEFPIVFKDGYVEVPVDQPGLGIALNESVVEKYRVENFV